MTSLVTSQKTTSCKCDTDFHTSTFTPPAHRKHIPAGGNRPQYNSHTSARERITQGRINKRDKGAPHDRQSKSVNSVTPINVGGVWQGTDKCQVALERRRMPLGSSSSLSFSLLHSPTLKRCPYSNRALPFRPTTNNRSPKGVSRTLHSNKEMGGYRG